MSAVKRIKYRPKTSRTHQGGKSLSSSTKRFIYISKDGETHEVDKDLARQDIAFLKEHKDEHMKDILNGSSQVRKVLDQFLARCNILYDTPNYSEITAIIQEVFRDVHDVHPGTVGAVVYGRFVDVSSKGFTGPEQYNPIRASGVPPDNSGAQKGEQDARIMIAYPSSGNSTYFQVNDSRSSNAYVFLYLTDPSKQKLQVDKETLSGYGVENVYVYTYDENTRMFSDVTNKNSFVASTLDTQATTNAVEKKKPTPQQQPTPSSNNGNNSVLWILLLLIGIAIVIALLWWALAPRT